MMMTQNICHRVKLELWVCLGIQLTCMINMTRLMSPQRRKLRLSPLDWVKTGLTIMRIHQFTVQFNSHVICYQRYVSWLCYLVPVLFCSSFSLVFCFMFTSCLCLSSHLSFRATPVSCCIVCWPLPPSVLPTNLCSPHSPSHLTVCVCVTKWQCCKYYVQ